VEPEQDKRSPDDEAIESELAEELLRLLHESYGTGAGSVHAVFSEEAVVVFFDDLELQKSEQFLVDQGHGESVVTTRSMYQQAIEGTFRAAVERIIGRRVTSFASITKLDPNYAVEIFRLAPSSGPDELTGRDA
jgi:uncharacterized protein YbcI